MEKLDLTRKNLRKFGITMGAVFIFLALFLIFRHKDKIAVIITASTAFFLSAFLMPSILKPVYIFWMRIAFILSWVNTRIILILIFYLIFAPLGLVIRLFGKGLLEKRLDKGAISYWKQKEDSGFDKLNYERQF